MRLARSVEEVRTFATPMLGATLVTVQTGPNGKQVNRLYIEDGATSTGSSLSALVDRQKEPGGLRPLDRRRGQHRGCRA